MSEFDEGGCGLSPVRDDGRIRRLEHPMLTINREMAELSLRLERHEREIKELQARGLPEEVRTSLTGLMVRTGRNRKVGPWTRFRRWLTCEGEPDREPPKDRRLEHQGGPVPIWMHVAACLALAALGLWIALASGRVGR